MATTGKTVADYTCRACGEKGHTQRTCPSKQEGAPAPKPKPARKPKEAPAVEEPTLDAAAVAKKLHWAIRGACDGFLTLDQLSDIDGADDVQAVVG